MTMRRPLEKFLKNLFGFKGKNLERKREHRDGIYNFRSLDGGLGSRN